MWVFAKGVGFISIVQDDTDADKLCVRARVRQHLEAAFPGNDEDIVDTPTADYAFRVTVSRDVVMDLLAESVADVDYTTNVKGEVSGDDEDLHDAMLSCWSALKRYQDGGEPRHGEVRDGMRYDEDDDAWYAVDDDEEEIPEGVAVALATVSDELETHIRESEEFDRRLQFEAHARWKAGL